MGQLIINYKSKDEKFRPIATSCNSPTLMEIVQGIEEAGEESDRYGAAEDTD